MRRGRLTETSQAAVELVLATIFWGFGFIGAIWALKSIGPFWMSGIRFTLAFIITLPVMLLISKASEFKGWRKTAISSFWPGLFLTLTIVLQTWGLKYTTATNAGFITTLYVVFVPLIEMIVRRKRMELVHLILVLLAVVGTALICRWQANVWNKGDLITLFCALAGGIHIVVISHYAAAIKAPFFFNNFQCFWAGVLSLALASTSETLQINNIGLLPILGFCSLLFGSTLFGFWAQIRAQRVLSTNSASLICLLESPFSALFAYFFLAERLNGSQWVGALLILVSAITTILLENRKNSGTSILPTN